jgi:hypothetical protein
VTSLEVYDASDRDFSVLDALFNPNATQPQSSFNIPPLEVGEGAKPWAGAAANTLLVSSR